MRRRRDFVNKQAYDGMLEDIFSLPVYASERIQVSVLSRVAPQESNDSCPSSRWDRSFFSSCPVTLFQVRKERKKMSEEKKVMDNEQELSEILQVRRDKLAELQQAGRNPFEQTKFVRSAWSSEIKDKYEDFNIFGKYF